MAAAPIVITDAKVTINNVNLSAWARSVTLDYQAETLDASTIVGLTRSRIPSYKDWSLEVDFNQDFAGSAVDAALFGLVGAAPFAVSVSGVGNPKFSGNAVLQDYPLLGAKVGGVAATRVKFDGSGPLTRTTNIPFTVATSFWSGGNATVNFGASAFNYTPPAGYAGWTSGGITTTWDPAAKSVRITLSNGNLTATADNTANYELVKATQYKSSGKWYCEFTAVAGSNAFIGVASSPASVDNYLGNDVNGYAWHDGNPGYRYHVGALTFYALGGGVVSMLFDADTGTLEFWENGASKGICYTGIGS